MLQFQSAGRFGAVEECRRGGIRLAEILAHAHHLGALAGKKKCRFHGSFPFLILPDHSVTTAPAQVRPAPKAISISVEPSPIRPLSRASVMARGIEAADVLPYRSMFT